MDCFDLNFDDTKKAHKTSNMDLLIEKSRAKMSVWAILSKITLHSCGVSDETSCDLLTSILSLTYLDAYYVLPKEKSNHRKIVNY